MEVSCVEGIASHNGPESCGAAREGGVEAFDSNIVTKPSGFWRNGASDLRGSGWRRMPTKHGLSSLAAIRNETDETGVTASRKRSSSWVLRTVAEKLGRGTFRYCDKRCVRDGKPSCGLCKKNCGDACTRPFGNRERSCARSGWATSAITECP